MRSAIEADTSAFVGKERVTFATGRKARAHRAEEHRPLRRAINIPVWGDLGLRLFGALFLVAVVVLVHWLDREGLRDSHDGVVSFLDVV